MSKTITIKSLILHYLLKQSRLGHQPDSKSILNHLRGFNHELSLRQLQRHLKKLVDNDRIEFHPRTRTYSIDEEHLESTTSSQERLERAMAYETIWAEQNTNHPLGHPIIAFEAYNNFKGAENLPILLQAIRENKVLEFHYINYYGDNVASDRRVAPLFLREYLNRWYLSAWDLKKNGQRLFGIDRIENLDIQMESFDPTVHYQACWDNFEHVVGLQYNKDDEPLEVMDLLIRSEKHNEAFLDSLPLHHSQKKIVTGSGPDEQVRYRYRVVANPELEQRLLSMSAFIEIEEPHWYRDAFKATLQEILGKYS